MGLDAFVFCDCHEKGRLRTPPPAGVSLKLEADGSLGRVSDDGTIESDLSWDDWRERRACEHAGGILLHHRLGNISLIGLLRSELQREPSRFPILLTQVVYNGSHGGDYIAVETIPALQRELELLGEFRSSTREAAGFMAQFHAQMSELAATARTITKPIAF
jgi:hypothetical protein